MIEDHSDAHLEEIFKRSSSEMSLEEFLTVVHTGNAAILKKLQKMDVENKDRDETIQKLMGAFPDGDISGHHRYHEAKINAKKDFARIRMEVYGKTATGVVWLILGFIGAAIWNHFILLSRGSN